MSKIISAGLFEFWKVIYLCTLLKIIFTGKPWKSQFNLHGLYPDSFLYAVLIFLCV